MYVAHAMSSCILYMLNMRCYKLHMKDAILVGQKIGVADNEWWNVTQHEPGAQHEYLGEGDPSLSRGKTWQKPRGKTHN